MSSGSDDWVVLDYGAAHAYCWDNRVHYMGVVQEGGYAFVEPNPKLPRGCPEFPAKSHFDVYGVRVHNHGNRFHGRWFRPDRTYVRIGGLLQWEAPMHLREAYTVVAIAADRKERVTCERCLYAIEEAPNDAKMAAAIEDAMVKTLVG